MSSPLLRVCLLCLLAAAFAVPGDARDAGSASLALRHGANAAEFEDVKITGGKTIHVDAARFMVQLFQPIKGGEEGEGFLCGGSLVSKRHVLSAGHCLDDFKSLIVIVGASEFMKLGHQGSRHTVVAAKAHPKYRVVTTSTNEFAVYDVAVFRLASDVELGPKVAIISITKPNVQPKARSVVNVDGWGLYKVKSQETSRKLRQGTYTAVSNADCKKAFGNMYAPQEFCIANDPTSAFCNGDSGGPVYQNNVQFGIVSWGSCGKEKPGYGVVTNLADPDTNSFVKKMIKSL